jgi:5-(carboxyamino)imidazole ribonucleotide mutase
MQSPVVGIIMGSVSDLDIMSEAAKVLDEFGVAYETRIVSAHRTPDVMADYAATAESRGIRTIIAGAGGSAHLPGMTASHTVLPVIAVPVKRDNHDHEALWSNIKMPPGIPLATMPENGAKNAALMAIEILALGDGALKTKYETYKQDLKSSVIASDEELQNSGWQSTLRK